MSPILRYKRPSSVAASRLSGFALGVRGMSYRLLILRLKSPECREWRRQGGREGISTGIKHCEIEGEDAKGERALNLKKEKRSTKRAREKNEIEK